jgi:hypothetical protein
LVRALFHKLSWAGEASAKPIQNTAIRAAKWLLDFIGWQSPLSLGLQPTAVPHDGSLSGGKTSRLVGEDSLAVLRLVLTKLALDCAPKKARVPEDFFIPFQNTGE